MAPKAIWSGVVSFGMVNIPVKLFSATRPKDITVNLLHARDGARIEQKRWCPVEDVEVPWDEVVRGYQYAKGRYVMLTDQDFEQLPLSTVKLSERERDMARALIEVLRKPFEPEAYHDRYREALAQLIESKLEGKEVVAAPPRREARVIDLAEALARSVAAARKGEAPRRGKKRAAGPPARARRRRTRTVARRAG